MFSTYRAHEDDVRIMSIHLHGQVGPPASGFNQGCVQGLDGWRRRRCQVDIRTWKRYHAKRVVTSKVVVTIYKQFVIQSHD